jgi:hypothetical protein
MTTGSAGRPAPTSPRDVSLNRAMVDDVLDSAAEGPIHGG